MYENKVYYWISTTRYPSWWKLCPNCVQNNIGIVHNTINTVNSEVFFSPNFVIPNVPILKILENCEGMVCEPRRRRSEQALECWEPWERATVVVVALPTSRRDGDQKLSDSLLERVSFEASAALSGFGTGAFRCRDVHGANRELSTVFLKTYVAEDPATSKLLAWCFVRSGANRIGAYRARSSICKRPRSPLCVGLRQSNEKVVFLFLNCTGLKVSGQGL